MLFFVVFFFLFLFFFCCVVVALLHVPLFNIVVVRTQGEGCDKASLRVLGEIQGNENTTQLLFCRGIRKGFSCKSMFFAANTNSANGTNTYNNNMGVASPTTTSEQYEEALLLCSPTLARVPSGSTAMSLMSDFQTLSLDESKMADLEWKLRDKLYIL